MQLASQTEIKSLAVNDQERMYRLGPLVNLPAIARSLGCDPDPIIREAGFSPEDFSHPDKLLPFVQSSKMLACFVEATGAEHLGLLMGQMANPCHLGLPGFMVHTAPTVRQALLSLVENLDIHDEGGICKLEIGPEYSSLGYALVLEVLSGQEVIYDLAAVMIYKILNLLFGKTWSVSSVSLARREPGALELYRRFYQTTLYFDAPHSFVTFSSATLDIKPPTANTLLFQHLEDEADLIHRMNQPDLARTLPGIFQRCLLSGKHAAAEVAEEMGIHERTLHRRLNGLNTSFRVELDRARQNMAQQLLTCSDLSIWEISTRLGYADSSGFIRAFERWLKVSPAIWRKNNRVS